MAFKIRASLTDHQNRDLTCGPPCRVEAATFAKLSGEASFCGPIWTNFELQLDYKSTHDPHTDIPLISHAMNTAQQLCIGDVHQEGALPVPLSKEPTSGYFILS